MVRKTKYLTTEKAKKDARKKGEQYNTQKGTRKKRILLTTLSGYFFVRLGAFQSRRTVDATGKKRTF